MGTRNLVGYYAKVQFAFKMAKNHPPRNKYLLPYLKSLLSQSFALLSHGHRWTFSVLSNVGARAMSSGGTGCLLGEHVA
jgi:hypothetical protein